MARHQGRNRLMRGFTKRLNVHELARGYVFLTRDPSLEEILNTRSFDVVVDGQRISDRSLDAYGRFWLPRQIMKNIGRRTANFLIESRVLRISTKR
jgi:hypothetical protein